MTELGIVPWWPAQPWFPLFNKLVIGQPFRFEPNIDKLSSPFRNIYLEQNFPGGREIIRQAFIRRGTPPAALTTTLASITDAALNRILTNNTTQV